MDFWTSPLGWTLGTVGAILLVTIGVLLSVAFLLLADRKIWAGVQMRKGPNVVGPFGLLQSFADFFKFVLKEVVVPAGSDKAVFLLARNAFDELGYRRLEWKCNARNARSRRAAERFGFSYEGLFRQHMIVKGENRDTAWYALLDGEWPQCRTAFQRWLAADNFDAEGRQKRRLEELRD